MTSRKTTKHRAIPASKSAPMFSAASFAAQVRETITDLHERLASDDGADPVERRKTISVITREIERLSKLTGETLDFPESKIVRMPAFVRLMREVGEALQGHPDALAAVVEALKRAEVGQLEERTGT